jgi:hypothetical protein
VILGDTFIVVVDKKFKSIIQIKETSMLADVLVSETNDLFLKFSDKTFLKLKGKGEEATETLLNELQEISK